MSKSVADIIAWVDEKVPNKVESTSKVIFLKELLGHGSEAYKFNTEVEWYDTATAADTNEYNLPSGVKVQDIVWIGVSNTTYNSTDVLGTTTPFTEYKFYGLEDSKIGSRYTEYTTQLSISPTPDDAYHMRILYKPNYANTSSNTTTILNMSGPLIEYLQNKVAASVCKSGSFPRIDLGNNYERDAETKLDTARTHYYNLKFRRQPKRNISWKRWW